MACGGGRLETGGRHKVPKADQWILNLPGELGADFLKFAKEIGFKDNQIQPQQDVGHDYYQHLMEKWLETIGHHTTKHHFIVYRALERIKQKDLLAKYFGGGAPEQCSDKWEDFLAELQNIDVSNIQQKEGDKTDRKKKKSRTKRKAKPDVVHQTNIYTAGGNVIVGDYAVMVEAAISTDVPDEEIRQQVREILKSFGAVGGNPIENTMNLQKLESCFHQQHSKSFKRTYGSSLLTYLDSDDVFVLRQTGFQWFVHMRDTPESGSNTNEVSEGLLKSSETKHPEKVMKSDSSKHNPPTFYRPRLDHSAKKQNIQNKCTRFDEFLKFVNNFRGGSYLLMISKTDLCKNMDALAIIPWLCVLDFDVNSRTDGLFYRVEDVLRKHRKGLYPCTWCDPPNIQTFGTEWCFVSGHTQEPESRTPDSFKTWYPHIKKKFEEHVHQINEKLDTVSILTVIACWPEDKATGMKFQKIITAINDLLWSSSKVVVIGNPPAEQEAFLDIVTPDYSLKENLDHVCHDLSINLGPQQQKALEYRLPTDDGTSVTLINNTLAASLRESMEILYLDDPSPSDASDLSVSEEEERLFFKGGTLSWHSYYTNGPEHFYVARDLLQTIVNDIRENFIEPLNSGVVKIYHSPGAGGTTLGQNILWNLHEVTPCIQIRTDSMAKPRQIAESISDLYNKTHCPIVVLFDGSDKNKFEQIQQQLNRGIAVFIYLERVSETKTNLDKNEYFLKGTLSANEARRMGPTFIRCCHDDVKKKDHIQRLVDDVVEKHVNHHLIEFGLVIQLHEFKGVASYVAEYLKIDRKSKELSANHRVLGYLSLVQFYGQGIMPCQMFGTLLGKSTDYMITYGNFPAGIKEFTVPVESGFVQNSIRICHFLIAREILDQLLSREPSCNQGLDLGLLAKSHLQPFVLEFIKYLRTRQDQTGQKSVTVLDIIIQTFIYRESGADHTKQGKRKFSRLIESIPSEQPFTERLHVMQNLAESFPFIPSLWAHLGRAYSLLCPTQHEITETFFQRAIQFCQATENQTDSEKDDAVLSFVLHMYGMFYLQRIKAEIAKCKKQSHPEMKFQDEIRKMFTLASAACKAFSDCRDYGFAGSQESFGCIGEINVRLHICELLKSHYKFDTIQGLGESSQNAEIVSYVKDSLSNIQVLFMKCFNTVDQSQIDDQFYRKITKYKILFKGMVKTNFVDVLNVPETFNTRCATIAGIKLKYGEEDHCGTINDIKEERDIKLVVALLEKNIADIKQPGAKYSNMDVDFVFIDWIQAIRHSQQKRKYTLEDVLINVRFWHKLIYSPYSIFYLFVLLCTLSIHPRRPCDVKILKEAMTLKKEEIERKKIGKQFSNETKPREWLGKETGIRCLERGITYEGSIEGKIIQDEAASFTLAVLTGTIRPPNKYRQRGYLNMYIDGNTEVQVKVSFCPFKTEENLVGIKYASSRVEFVLAFTAQSGFEAYNVKLLKKSTCKKCGEQVEIVSVEKNKECKCRELVENEFPCNKSNKSKAEESQNQ